MIAPTKPDRKRSRLRYGYVVLRALTVALVALVFGLVVKLLWNALLPALFGVRAVTYWQAVGLLILARILFNVGLDYRRYRFTSIAGPLARRRDFVEWWQQTGKRAFEEYAAQRGAAHEDD